MSGIKESAIALRAERALLIETAAGVNRGLALADALLEEAEAVASQAQDQAPFLQVIAELRPLVDEAAKVEGQIRKLTNRWMTSTSRIREAVAEGQRMLDAVYGLRGKVENLRDQLGTEAQMVALDRRLASLTSRLSKWSAEHVTQLQESIQTAKTTIEAEIRTGRSAHDGRALVAQLSGHLEALEASVSRREQQDEARRQVIAAIEEACKNLGFTIEHAPIADPNEPRRFEVNTGCYGILAFEMSLDSVLRTTCPNIQPKVCENWVERFEEQMSRFGVGIQFRYRDTGRPVRRDKASRGFGADQQVSVRGAGGFA